MDSSRNYYGASGNSSGRGHRGGGGGGGGRYRPYRGGGRGRGGGGSRGGGGGHRNQPYRPRGGGRGGGGGRGNRFGSQQQIDPETVLLRQIASFVSRVGEFQNLREAPENESLRTVEYTAASNINDLLPILCAPDKLELLLKYSPHATQPEDKVGKLVHLVISCVADLPMQTPCYAALTLAVHEQVQGTPYQGFATRCLQYALLQIAKELDTTMLTSNPAAAQSTCRLKLLLRYLCILANMGLLTAYEGEATVDPNHMTVFGFISVFVDAATAAAEQFHNVAASSWLALMVLSAIPYLMESQSIPHDVIENKIRKPLDHLLSNYQSTFTPGTGMTALLLKAPQVEDDDEDDQDDEEEDDENEAEGSGQICDSLQDLLRATKYWRKEGQACRFALPLDAPWKGLLIRAVPNSESGEGTDSRPIVYSDSPLYLSFPQECQLLNLLLSGVGSDSLLKLQYFTLEGAVFGRLPIFGSPPDPEGADDDDDEDEIEDGANKNERLESFRAMSLLDRYFIGESLRDTLLSHESYVTPAGLQLGSAKSAAEELLRVCHLFPQSDNDDISKGIEYAILEAIFALLAQSNNFSSLRHIYLSRVLLELIRLEPSRISQALAVAMTNLFQDYLPALVPAARENFSTWFAFHLANTDYQWPSAYWQLWEPYVTSDRSSSRGAFVRRSLHLMTENVSDPTAIVKQSFGGVSQSLVKEMLNRSCVPIDHTPDEAIENEVNRRLWDNQEDPAVLLEYLQSDEVSLALGSSGWPRIDVLMRVLLDPARQLHESTKVVLEKAAGGIEGDQDDMKDDSKISKDVYITITNAIQRYKATLLGVLGKDADSKVGDKDDALVHGGAYLLRRTESIVAFNACLLEGVLVSLLQNGVLEGLSVLKWVLRDEGDSLVAPILSSWYKYASIAVREGLLLSLNDATMGGIMVLDSENAIEEEFVTKYISKVVRLLNYAICRVCSLLETTQVDEVKLKPIHIDLVEGMKVLVFTSKKLLCTTSARPAGIMKQLPASVIEILISKSGMSGASLAASCSTKGSSVAMSLLKKSLENM